MQTGRCLYKLTIANLKRRAIIKLPKSMNDRLERMSLKMKKVLKALSLLMAAALVLACFAGCTGGEGTGESSNAQGGGNSNSVQVDSPALEDGVMTVGTNAEFPPFEFIGADGQPDGFDMAMMKEIGKILGVEVKIENMEFKTALASIGKRVDVVAAGLSVDEERALAMDFSDPYYTAVQSVLVKKGGSLQPATLEDLKGKKIGVQEGTTGDKVATKQVQDSTVSRFKKGVDAVLDLQNGRIDAVIIDKTPAEVFAKTYDTVEIAKMNENTFEAEEYAIGIVKGDTALREAINKALKTLRENGKYDELVKQYL